MAGPFLLCSVPLYSSVDSLRPLEHSSIALLVVSRQHIARCSKPAINRGQLPCRKLYLYQSVGGGAGWAILLWTRLWACSVDRPSSLVDTAYREGVEFGRSRQG